MFNLGSVDRYFAHGCAETLKVLPAIPEPAVTPDLQHNVLQRRSLSVAAVAAMAVRQAFRR